MWNEVIELVKKGNLSNIQVIKLARDRAETEINKELAKVCTTEKAYETASADISRILTNMAEGIHYWLQTEK